MWTPKTFLEQECSNLGHVLRETLRFKYGLDGSKEFFEECQVRLAFIKSELAVVSDDETKRLRKLTEELGDLSGLISRIERSSIEEYSWPFVQRLKDIANSACSEATLKDPKSLPMVHVLSDGGLDAYRIYPEQSRPSSSKKRILTIVFPRTLRHFVLLHSILGHELGHAMWSSPQHQGALRYILQKHLTAEGAFKDEAATAAWLYAEDAPTEVKKQLHEWNQSDVDEGTFFSRAAVWDAWIEEILCDFIGIATFGPSFIAACCNLFYAVDPSGLRVGPEHPPVACRANYLLTAATHLGLDRIEYKDSFLNESVDRFWQALRSKRHSDKWCTVFSETQIRGAIEAISQYMANLPPAGYVQPNEGDLSSLLSQIRTLVPPAGFKIGRNLTFQLRSVDFRHVLYAGWVVSTDAAKIPFEKINRLCEHAIMQQLAIDTKLLAN